MGPSASIRTRWGGAPETSPVAQLRPAGPDDDARSISTHRAGPPVLRQGAFSRTNATARHLLFMAGMSLSIRFCGVRGSCPTPGPETALVGGNTSCVEVVAGSTRIALDAGTGLRRLGGHLLAQRRGPVDLTVLLSHVHWDHI